MVKRTIKRDIEFMKDRLNLPIEFDAKQNGYYYTESVEQFPADADERGGRVRDVRGEQGD